jgi:hypothetical protein
VFVYFQFQLPQKTSARLNHTVWWLAHLEPTMKTNGINTRFQMNTCGKFFNFLHRYVDFAHNCCLHVVIMERKVMI